MDAERAYLFRHGLLRAAAYELQMPHDRAGLHHLVLDIVEETLAATDDSALADAWAPEIAEHARMAAESGNAAALAEREIHWRKRAAQVASRSYALDDGLRQWRLVEEHPHASDQVRRQAGFEYAKLLATAGHTRDCVARLRSILPTLEGEPPIVRADVLLNLGQALISMGELPEAREVIEQGLAACQLAARPDTATKFGYLKLRCDRMEGKWESALEVVNEIIKTCTEDPKEQIKMMFFRASILNDLERADETLASLLAIEKMAALQDAPELKMISLGSLGLALRDRGRSEEGLPMLMEAVNWYRQAGDRRLEASFTGAAAAAVFNLHRYAECLELGLLGAQVAADSGNRREEHVALGMAGIALIMLRRFEEAQRTLETALRVATQMSDPMQAARHAAYIAVARFADGKSETFSQDVNTALADLRALGREEAADRLSREVDENCRELNLTP